MNVTLPKNVQAPGDIEMLKPGTWTKDDDGRVLVRCPHADHADKRPRIGTIHHGKDHKDNWNIDAQGNVTPSIFFPESACGWHVNARLEGWTG